MMKIFFITTVTLLIFGCNSHRRDSLNKIYPLQEPNIRTVINLNEIKDSISLSMEIIWDNKPIDEKESLNKPKNNEEILKEISCIQSGSDSSLLILDSRRSRIVKLSKNGKWLGVIGSLGSGPGEMIEPRWMVYQKNKIYICDQKNGRLQILDESGKYIRQINNFISGDMKFRFGVGKNGEIVTRTNYGDSNLIAIYDSLGRLIKKFGNYYENEYGYYNEIQQLGLNHMWIIVDTMINNIWCIFENIPQIRRYDFNGNYLEDIRFEGEKLKIFFDAFHNNDRKNKEYMLNRIKAFSSSPFIHSANIFNNNLYISLGLNTVYCINLYGDKSIISKSYNIKEYSKKENMNYIINNVYYFNSIYSWTINKSILKGKIIN